MSRLRVTHQSLVLVVLHCHKRNKLIVYFLFFFQIYWNFFRIFQFCTMWVLDRFKNADGGGGR